MQKITRDFLFAISFTALTILFATIVGSILDTNVTMGHKLGSATGTLFAWLLPAAFYGVSVIGKPVKEHRLFAMATLFTLVLLLIAGTSKYTILYPITILLAVGVINRFQKIETTLLVLYIVLIGATLQSTRIANLYSKISDTTSDVDNVTNQINNYLQDVDARLRKMERAMNDYE